MDTTNAEPRCLKAILDNNINDFNRYFPHTLLNGTINPIIKTYKLITLLFDGNFSDYYCLFERLDESEANSPEIEVALAVERCIRTNNIIGLRKLANTLQGELVPVIKAGIDMFEGLANKRKPKIADRRECLKEVVLDCIESHKHRLD